MQHEQVTALPPLFVMVLKRAFAVQSVLRAAVPGLTKQEPTFRTGPQHDFQRVIIESHEFFRARSGPERRGSVFSAEGSFHRGPGHPAGSPRERSKSQLSNIKAQSGRRRVCDYASAPEHMYLEHVRARTRTASAFRRICPLVALLHDSIIVIRIS